MIFQEHRGLPGQKSPIIAIEPGAGIIVAKYCAIIVPAVCHDGGSYLTHSHSVPPTGTVKNKIGTRTSHDKGRTVQVRRRQYTPDIKLLADGLLAPRTDDTQADDASRRAAPQRFETGYLAKSMPERRATNAESSRAE